MTIRPEQPTDIDALFHLTEVAFRPHPFGRRTEQFILRALRDANALTLCLVAEVSDVVVGYAAWSPVTIADGSLAWYGLGPVAVRPNSQRQGIGSALIRDGLSRMEARGAAGCVVLGNPAYYGRFGFAPDPALVLEGVDAKHFMALRFNAPAQSARGIVRYHSAFDATG